MTPTTSVPGETGTTTSAEGIGPEATSNEGSCPPAGTVGVPDRPLVAGCSPDEELATIEAPRDLPGAEALLVRLGEDEEEIAAIEASAAKAIQAIEKRRDSIKRKAERRGAYLRLLIEEYAKSHRSEIVRGGKKSRELLGGTIGFRTKAERLVVTDKPALVAWVESQPDTTLCRVKVEPDMKAIQAQFKQSGIMPPGTDLEVESETVQITTAPMPTLKE